MILCYNTSRFKQNQEKTVNSNFIEITSKSLYTHLRFLGKYVAFQEEPIVLLPLEELLLGKIAFRQGYISPEELEECIRIQEQQAKRDGPIKPIGQIMLDKGFINEEQLDKILLIQKTALDKLTKYTQQKRSESLFGKIALKLGLLNQEQLNDALRVQAKLIDENALYLRLGEILERKGYLTKGDVSKILEVQNKTIYLCEKCVKQYNIIGATEDEIYFCKSCNSPLVKQKTPYSIRADETAFGISLKETKEEKNNSNEKNKEICSE